MRRSYLYPLTLLIASALAACADGIVIDIDGNADAVRGSGTIVTEERSIDAFDHITLAGEGEVIVVQGPDAALTIETDDNLLPLIDTTVSGTTLEIATKPGVDLDPTSSIVYRVDTPDVSGLTLTGAGSLRLDECDAETFSIALSGAGDISIGALTATNLDVTISGAGSVVVAGEVTSQAVNTTGAGDYNGRHLQSSEATVTSSGVGSATVWVTDTLDANVSGVGSVEYFGSPQVTESVSGVGSINDRGDA